MSQFQRNVETRDYNSIFLLLPFCVGNLQYIHCGIRVSCMQNLSSMIYSALKIALNFWTEITDTVV